jgi:hypothetical protein
MLGQVPHQLKLNPSKRKMITRISDPFQKNKHESIKVYKQHFKVTSPKSNLNEKPLRQDLSSHDSIKQVAGESQITKPPVGKNQLNLPITSRMHGDSSNAPISSRRDPSKSVYVHNFKMAP